VQIGNVLSRIVGALLLVVVAAVDAAEQGFKSGVFDPPRAAPDFTLAGSDHAPLTLSAFRGKVVAVVFGFSYCQKVCPTNMAALSRVATELGAAARDFQVVFVTVDPERDSPDRLAEYLAFFDPSFRGATGTEEELGKVRAAWGITAERELSTDQQLKYQVHHSSSVFLVDRAGQLRLLVPFGQPPEAIVHDIRLLLAS
jgi:protein SCO1/2